MTHTIADAEAAIARHPTDLEQLSMAADLLQELGDPRGEDFAACLGGASSDEELMRKYPACRCAMFVAAWAMADNRPCSLCAGRSGFRLCPDCCHWSGRVPKSCRCRGKRSIKCECRDERAARAEALRLLAECGKVGGHPSLGYKTMAHMRDESSVSERWIDAALTYIPRGRSQYEVVPIRFAMLCAYAAADPNTRRQWAEETRALTPTLKPTH